jgi:hypothetical protein
VVIYGICTTIRHVHISYGYHRLLGKDDFTDLLEISKNFEPSKKL